jgi:[ribosomal protein S5]-alanine N-acetyltransferase
MRLTTDRLVLRPFRADDFAAVHAYATDPEVVRFQDWGPNTVADTRFYLDRMISPAETQHPFAIEQLADGAVVGAVEVQIASVDHRRAEMGYVLHRSAWGRGYATEAAAAILRYGFDELDLHKISATCDPDNVASARILEKIGMRREGLLKEHLLIRGEWRDRLLWAALSGSRSAAADRPPSAAS